MQIRWSGVAAGAFLLAGATACANAVNSVPQPRTPAATPQLAFVVNATVSPPVLGEYPVGATTPVRTIDQPAGTFGMRIDASGTLYRVVATGASYEVQEIAAGTTQPARTISLGSNQPYGMEFDGSGALWIASAQGTLAKYPLAATSPSLVIHPR
ncbi:MAG TPA: hypothetical protein VNG31_01905, partial [Candidatus Baltobacteraceae bacterium]|nr:hypothetical protein [Candidatus Baltobacteraceae bacterium]